MKQATGWRIGLLVLLGLTLIGACSQGPQETLKESPAHKLVGIIEGDPEHARAIFEEVKTKKQRLYRLGEEIDGATILEIKHQQVLLQKGEEIIVVHLATGSPGEGKPGESIPVPVGIRDPKQALQKVLSQEIPPYDPMVEKMAVSRREVDIFREHFLKGTPTFVPTVVGPALGLAGMDEHLLNILGLNPTDLIVGISGMGLDSPDRLRQILVILGRARVFNFSVLRGEVVYPQYYTVQ